MKQFIIFPVLAMALLSGCAAPADPAAVITGKPDQARSASLVSAVQTVVADLESTRDANGSVTLSNPVIPGFSTKVKPHGTGANYCVVVTDSTTGNAKTYTSIDTKTVDGSKC